MATVRPCAFVSSLVLRGQEKISKNNEHVLLAVYKSVTLADLC